MDGNFEKKHLFSQSHSHPTTYHFVEKERGVDRVYASLCLFQTRVPFLFVLSDGRPFKTIIWGSYCSTK